ncbi:hypothetical protein [Burkholderia sp. L27(2015)]|uniref:hypothetical protein n=1 Tax=Burkholderia sp. L27(2015) TaxID=1641858 RepID=UPI00131B683F|nr:hypothetical protein [Burkholderia sp. L27(2015)]
MQDAFPSEELQPVDVGQPLTATITLQSQGATGFAYECSFDGGPSITTKDVDQLTWACFALEGYGAEESTPLPNCQAYPASSPVTFSGIELKIGQTATNCEDATLEWTSTCSFTNCSQGVGPVDNSCPGGSVAIQFQSNA